MSKNWTENGHGTWILDPNRIRDPDKIQYLQTQVKAKTIFTCQVQGELTQVKSLINPKRFQHFNKEKERKKKSVSR